MDYASTMSAPTYLKRPGSPIGSSSMPPSKISRLGSNQLQINYLVRQKEESLPLVTAEDRMPRVLELIGEYDGVLQRHESIAGNLGACPLGPILLKRFERLFDGPPRVLKSHAKDPSVSWLDVVEFAQNRPEQFNLEKQRNGVRVCQFYHKQCRVEISEEDYVLIASGMPQKLIPPQPIFEDEEKELGAIEILERNLSKVVQMADTVSARARQINHKLKGRKSAIISRRHAESDTSQRVLQSNDSPRSPTELIDTTGRPLRSIEKSQSPPAGFTAVNHRYTLSSGSDAQPSSYTADSLVTSAHHLKQSMSNINGTLHGPREDNISKFLTASERQAGMTENTVRRSSSGLKADPLVVSTDPSHRHSPYEAGSEPTERYYTKKFSSVADSPTVSLPNTPSTLANAKARVEIPRDDGGPFKAEMVTRMENMARGERVMPPCDRCRRLQMDCMKNLTACQGCTKKHAKCSWKDVTAEELRNNPMAASSGAYASPPPRHSLDRAEPVDSSMPQYSMELAEDERDRSPGDTIEVVPSKSDRDQPEPPQSVIEHPPVPDSTTPRQSTAQRSVSPQKLMPWSPKFDVRPPRLSKPAVESTSVHRTSLGGGSGPSIAKNNGHVPQSTSPYADLSSSSMPKARAESQPARITEADHDESDRLQELARQVYRSASQSIRPPSN